MKRKFENGGERPTEQPGHSLVALRRICRTLERQTFEPFAKQFFTERIVDVSDTRLDRFAEIPRHTALAP